MKFSKIAIILFLVPLFAFTMHKYYVSLCEVAYVEKEKSIQIIIGLFIDDLELTLNKEHNTEFHLATENEQENIDEVLEFYLNEHLTFKVNNEYQPYMYIGKEYDNDIARFYLEITDIDQLSSIEITNTCLFKNFEEQQNIIKINVNKLHKTYYLTTKNANCLLKL